MGATKTFPSWECSELRLEQEKEANSPCSGLTPGPGPARRTRTGRALNGQDVRTHASGRRDWAFLSSSQRTDRGIPPEPALVKAARTGKQLAAVTVRTRRDGIYIVYLLLFVCSVGWWVGGLVGFFLKVGFGNIAFDTISGSREALTLVTNMGLSISHLFLTPRMTS